MKTTTRLAFLFLFCTTRFLGLAQNAGRTITDDVGVVITQNSTHLFPGQELEISVIGTCAKERRVKKVTIGGYEIAFYKDNIAVFKTLAGAVGVHEIPVVVHFGNTNATSSTKTYSLEYTVGQPTFAIGNDRMNVLYVGIDNPITVAASRAGDEEIVISIAGGGGTLTRVGAGRFIVRVKSPTDNCRISVSADGRLVGVTQFRVRPLPLPVGMVGGRVSGDSVSAKVFMAQEGISAGLRNVPIDLTYTVTGCTMNIQDEKGVVKSTNFHGALFTPEVKQFMQENLKPGTIVTIGNLYVKTADAAQMKLLPLVYHITESASTGF